VIVASGAATSQKAFTLMEVLISIFILVTVLTTVFASYTGTFRIIDETESQAEAYQMARIAMHRIREDLESVFVYTPQASTNESGFGVPEEPVGGESLSFVGEPDTLRFPTTAHVGFGKETQSGQIAVVTYEIREDTRQTATGRYFLLRKDVPLNDIIRGEVTGDEPESPPSYPVCKNLVRHENVDGVKFTYFDAEDVDEDSWDSAADDARLPKKVQVELHFANASDSETAFMFTFSAPLQVQTASKDDRF